MKQVRSQQSSKANLKWLKSKMAAMKMGKTERANSFLADPAAFGEEQPEMEEVLPEVEPWLQDYQTSEPALQQERVIRNQINAMLAAERHPDRESGSLDVEKVDSNLITKKMKKYQPANSSFSLFYGEKKGLEKMQGEDHSSQHSSRISKQQFKLPILPVKKSSHDINALREAKKGKKAFFSCNSLSQASPGRHLDFLSQLRTIEKEGEVLTNFSSRLIHRIDRVTDLVDRKFQVLNQITEDMTADVGTYRLEEEIDGSYKKEEYITPPRFLKK